MFDLNPKERKIVIKHLSKYNAGDTLSNIDTILQKVLWSYHCTTEPNVVQVVKKKQMCWFIHSWGKWKQYIEQGKIYRFGGWFPYRETLRKENVKGVE